MSVPWSLIMSLLSGDSEIPRGKRNLPMGHTVSKDRD